jgi:probable rRNA maturation factor
MAPAKQEQDIVVQIAKNFDGLDFELSKLKKLVKTVCSRYKLSKATVSVAIVDDTEIKRLNKQFLNRNDTTDCLSFNLSDDQRRYTEWKSSHTVTKGNSGRKEKSLVSCERTKLFDLVVNGELAVKEAKLRGHSGEAELALYITHGLLHNLGFDDSTKSEAKKMHGTEDEILQQLGYGLVYNKNKTAP